LPVDASALLGKVDGERSVSDLARECGFTLYEATHLVVDLVRRGLVEVTETMLPEPPGALPLLDEPGADADRRVAVRPATANIAMEWYDEPAQVPLVRTAGPDPLQPAADLLPDLVVAAAAPAPTAPAVSFEHEQPDRAAFAEDPDLAAPRLVPDEQDPEPAAEDVPLEQPSAVDEAPAGAVDEAPAGAVDEAPQTAELPAFEQPDHEPAVAELDTEVNSPADTAALMRELSSLGADPPSAAPTSNRRTAAPVPEPHKRRRFFGR
jgi:hypothetical protein